jgi:hypothetical protein
MPLKVWTKYLFTMLMEVLMQVICAQTSPSNFPIRDFERAQHLHHLPQHHPSWPGALYTPLHWPELPRKFEYSAPSPHLNRQRPWPLTNMASKVTIDASATSKPKPSAAAPIEPLKNDVARIYTHLHPVVVLSLYAYKFNAIVADPVPALLSILAPLAVLQIAYVAVCLPPTGETPKVKKTKPGEKKKHAPGKLESGVNGTIVVC